MHTGLPLAWRVTVELFGFDAREIERQHGLEFVIGNPLLAQLMGPDAALASRFDGPGGGLVCEECFMKPYALAQLFDSMASRGVEPKEDADGPPPS